MFFGKLSPKGGCEYTSSQLVQLHRVGCRPCGEWVFTVDISVPVYLFGPPHRPGGLACVGEQPWFPRGFHLVLSFSELPIVVGENSEEQGKGEET